MRCTSPRTVGFQSDGRTLAWSSKKYSKEYATFQLPCGKCLECRLDYARQWAVRCVHEAQMYEQNAFVTLTYSDENLKSPKLIYSDFQKFMKKLRKGTEAMASDIETRKVYNANPIGVFVTGEYGDQTKRPHWHALLFNWSPRDGVLKYTNHRGDRVFQSETLNNLWGHGISEYGSVTFHSAGYCARYAAKKLGHGRDGTHDYNPISKKSSKHAIGKKWLEKYWPDVFNQGQIILPGGEKCSIPRYYEKWFKEHMPTEWLLYVTQVKIQKGVLASETAAKEKSEQEAANDARRALTLIDGRHRGHQISPLERRRRITQSKFEQLQNYLKLK